MKFVVKLKAPDGSAPAAAAAGAGGDGSSAEQSAAPQPPPSAPAGAVPAQAMKLAPSTEAAGQPGPPPGTAAAGAAPAALAVAPAAALAAAPLPATAAAPEPPISHASTVAGAAAPAPAAAVPDTSATVAAPVAVPGAADLAGGAVVLPSASGQKEHKEHKEHKNKKEKKEHKEKKAHKEHKEHKAHKEHKHKHKHKEREAGAGPTATGAVAAPPPAQVAAPAQPPPPQVSAQVVVPAAPVPAPAAPPQVSVHVAAMPKPPPQAAAPQAPPRVKITMPRPVIKVPVPAASQAPFRPSAPPSAAPTGPPAAAATATAIAPKPTTLKLKIKPMLKPVKKFGSAPAPGGVSLQAPKVPTITMKRPPSDKLAGAPKRKRSRLEDGGAGGEAASGLPIPSRVLPGLASARLKGAAPRADDAEPGELLKRKRPPEPPQAPYDDNAVGWKIRLYWTKMKKFYVGKVVQYDTTRARHIIHYADGEVRTEILNGARVQFVSWDARTATQGVAGLPLPPGIPQRTIPAENEEASPSDQPMGLDTDLDFDEDGTPKLMAASGEAMHIRPPRRTLEDIVAQLMKKDRHQVFYFPVTDLIAPGYTDVISKPMDFGTLRRRTQASRYGKWKDFWGDLRLIFDNCMRYNGPDTWFHKEAKRLLSAAERAVAEGRSSVKMPPKPPPKALPETSGLSSLSGGGDGTSTAAGGRGTGPPPAKRLRGADHDAASTASGGGSGASMQPVARYPQMPSRQRLSALKPIAAGVPGAGAARQERQAAAAAASVPPAELKVAAKPGSFMELVLTAVASPPAAVAPPAAALQVQKRHPNPVPSRVYGSAGPSSTQRDHSTQQWAEMRQTGYNKAKYETGDGRRGLTDDENRRATWRPYFPRQSLMSIFGPIKPYLPKNPEEVQSETGTIIPAPWMRPAQGSLAPDSYARSVCRFASKLGAAARTRALTQASEVMDLLPVELSDDAMKRLQLVLAPPAAAQ